MKQNVLVLPAGRSVDSFISTLAHPRSSRPARYLIDPLKGIYEFTRISPPKTSYRSWLLIESVEDGKPVDKSKDNESQSPKVAAEQGASIISNPDLLVATPIDPVFFIIPTLYTLAGGEEGAKGLFLSADDILENASKNCPQLGMVIKHASIRAAIEARLPAACDSVQAGDESMYRLSERKLLQELLAKAVNLQKTGLLRSMEEKFIQGALDLPVTFQAQEVSASLEHETSLADSTSGVESNVESQSSLASSDTASFAESSATGITTPDVTETGSVAVQSAPGASLLGLLRTQTLLKYLLSSYIPSSLIEKLQMILKSDESPIDLTPLEERLNLVAKLRAEALAARSAADFSRKRNAYEDDELAEERAEKKRKKEEDEKRKKQEPRGIKNLKKADTSGMKKLSSFFGVKAAAKT